MPDKPDTVAQDAILAVRRLRNATIVSHAESEMSDMEKYEASLQKPVKRLPRQPKPGQCNCYHCRKVAAANDLKEG